MTRPAIPPRTCLESALRRLRAALIELNAAYDELMRAEIPGLASSVTQEAEQGYQTLGSRSSRGDDASAGIAKEERA